MVMEKCFLERPASRCSGKARKQVFWKGQKTGFSYFRRLGAQYKYLAIPPFWRRILRSDHFTQSSDKP